MKLRTGGSSPLGWLILENPCPWNLPIPGQSRQARDAGMTLDSLECIMKLSLTPVRLVIWVEI